MIFHSWDECLPWIDPLTDLDQRCFPEAPWESSDWKRLFNGLELMVMTQEEKSMLVGYVVFSSISPETELLRVGVDPQYRRQSWGRTLITRMIPVLSKQKIQTVFLEVRDDNQPAIGLYQNLGFRIIGRRKKYYARPTCDAVLYSLNLHHQTQGTWVHQKLSGINHT